MERGQPLSQDLRLSGKCLVRAEKKKNEAKPDNVNVHKNVKRMEGHRPERKGWMSSEIRLARNVCVPSVKSSL